MAGDLNIVSVIGRLVRDPEIKYTSSGKPVAKFSIANNEIFVVNNERKENVNYFDINVWGNQATNCEKYLKKGSQVAVTGTLRQNRWTDQAGQTKSRIEITASSVQFLTPPSTQQNTGYNQQNSSNNYQNNKQNNNNNNGIIEDPWGDNRNSANTYNDPYEDGNISDDDIPF